MQASVVRSWCEWGVEWHQYAIGGNTYPYRYALAREYRGMLDWDRTRRAWLLTSCRGRADINMELALLVQMERFNGQR